MDSQKISALSELTLETEEIKTLIIRYWGEASAFTGLFLSFDELLFGFAIVTFRSQDLARILAHPLITYVEASREFAPQLISGKHKSCLSPLYQSNLTGEGVISAIIDTGIDYQNPEFRNEDGSSRILAIYDDNSRQFYTRKTINDSLAGKVSLPILDSSGHGSAVASIMAGNKGIAPKSDILILKLQNLADDYTVTSSLLRCFTYAVKSSETLGKPVSINLSYGTTAGSHMGDSLLEQYINMLTGYGKSSIVIGSGNEGSSGRCAEGSLTYDMPEKTVGFSTGTQTGRFLLLVYTRASDSVTVSLEAPSDSYQVKTASSGPSPYALYREQAFQITQTDRIGGIWTIHLTGEVSRSLPIFYRIYLSVPADFDARFFVPTQQATFTIPSTAANVISVGAYNPVFDSYAPFSGRGVVRYIDTAFGQEAMSVKPELVAPGASVTLSDGSTVSGTSFAAPFVSGTAALMMQWGIVLGNAPNLYGQAIKSAMIKGARPLQGEPLRPNERTGYGALCAANSLPI